MTTAICFDLDGTLLRFDRSYRAVRRAVFEETLGEATPAMLEASGTAFFDAIAACEPEPYHTAVAAALDAAEGDVDADIDDVVETLLVAEKRATNVPPGTRESLDALAAENPLAVVTNGTSEFQREKLAHHDLTDYFETVVTAYDVGASKPDAAIFEAVREQIDAEEYVMVGDDYEADVEGARGAGFVPVHVEDTEDAPDFWATLQAFV
jgi:putative hydrolase of the HAD superfamily